MKMIEARSSSLNGQDRTVKRSGGDVLMETEFPKVNWLIEDYLPEGLTILAGAPKAGKSFLMLQAALSVITGEPFFGKHTERSLCLYVCLEDGGRRTQKRLKIMMANHAPWIDMSWLQFIFDCPRLDQGGLAALKMHLVELREVKLLCIDTWGRFAPLRPPSFDLYQWDSESIGALRVLTLTQPLAILLNAHTRKMADVDFLQRVIGSNGLTGGCDTVWVLSRSRKQEIGTLEITGRDVEEVELAVEFNRETLSWVSHGPAGEHQKATQKMRVLEKFAVKRSWTIEDLMRELDGVSRSTLDNTLYRLKQDGRITSTHRGIYELAEQ